ncbi:RES domain-containing protein [Pseudoroseomonas wenyumeiae]|uniref:RES domain-containing protein n=1 Tax=Teichococcus wenyumeiae TaxID=2478470 RepID=A0A3A9JFZ6_9PROT|nr:RES family NAD+ phosphorylase [Pseudoroseomonas wenyumeiae]RKK05230.1 RES domain-containing protein [Pseudoroseomonas wenyumeiae]RMI19900.1 RES domain-containing protein [Pseudoroseomonas wenyumeiae]
MDAHAAAPAPSYRLIPSKFPPIGLFDTVATAADAEAVMELAGWTNDRLVEERLRRLPEAEWVYGRPNSSVVMATFLHAPPSGARFNGPDLGAWYAAASLRTAAIEVAHHLRREAVATGAPRLQRAFRTYTASLAGDYLDLRGQQAARPEVYATGSYAASQLLGESIRASGGAGIIYDSVRHAGGTNIVAHRPRNILQVTQADHWLLAVQAASPRISLKRLSGA